LLLILACVTTILLCAERLTVGPAQASGRLVLFTPEEASKLRVSEEEWRALGRPRGAADGPRILWKVPEMRQADGGPMIDAKTPADLVVAFEKNRAAVNMSSLEVRARKGLFSKSLTSLLRPYLVGETLEARNVEVPEGRFTIEIEIADVEGSETSETYRLNVTSR
jgi:hypothetical protein